MQHPGMARLQGQGFMGMPMSGMAGHAAQREEMRSQAGVETMQEDKSGACPASRARAALLSGS